VNSRFRNDALVFVALVGFGAATRLVPYYSSFATWNLNAIGAFALFAGFYFQNRLVACVVPLLATLLADVVIGQFMGNYRWEMMAAVYLAATLPVLLGPWLRQKLGVLRVGVGALGASLAFFLITNCAYWFCFMPHTQADLVQAYVNAVPFFRGTLAGNLIFSAATFGLYSLTMHPGLANASDPQTDAVSV
jgi:hypothetical protein